MMMSRLLPLYLLGVAALPMLTAPTAVWATDQKPAACADHTPHKVRFVKVAPGVELEVLDWGGKGKAMVLLAGGGDNAHVYDQFAYQFTDYFHVIGITRRGYLPSSQPRNGYDIPTRAADDIAVLDALGIDKAVFVGHSAAGMELSRLGQAHKDRIEKLVYLDASDLSERYLPSRLEPPPPDYTDADLKSLWAYQAATARFQALRTPIPALCHGLKFCRGRSNLGFHDPGLGLEQDLTRPSRRARRRTGQASRRRGSASSLCSRSRQGRRGTGI